jgi:16S rRNA (adenine1518-N6/adenine1519-N6)-dimethyltransferase
MSKYSSNSDRVNAKKHLGQHFLINLEAAHQIANSLQLEEGCKVLEVGPGMGVLTNTLLQKHGTDLYVVEIDNESIEYLNKHLPELTLRIINADFLRLNMREYFPDKYAIIGNFPYNISSQIMFRVLDEKDHVVMVSGMFQKEVSDRIHSGPGNKDYGILSVLMQTWYDIEYLMTLEPEDFAPRPKVKSGVLRFKRKSQDPIDLDEKFYKVVIKTGFNQRRKTLRNALKSILPKEGEVPFLDKRAEQLSPEDFQELTRAIIAARL